MIIIIMIIISVITLSPVSASPPFFVSSGSNLQPNPDRA